MLCIPPQAVRVRPENVANDLKGGEIVSDESQSEQASTHGESSTLGGISGLAAIGLDVALVRYIPSIHEFLAAGVAGLFGSFLFVSLVLSFLLFWGMSQFKTLQKYAQNVAVAALIITWFAGFLNDWRSSHHVFPLQANMGWQDTGVKVSSSPSVYEIDVSGAINIAVIDSYHLVELLKPMIRRGLNKSNPMPPLTEDNSFHHSWTFPDGKNDDSKDTLSLGAIRMNPRQNWGVVLCTAQETPPNRTPTEIARTDPWAVFELDPEQDIKTFTKKRMTGSFPSSGELYCMVNDAVISVATPSTEQSKSYFRALMGMNAELQRASGDHVLRESEIPLILLDDNIGTFTLSIRQKYSIFGIPLN